MDPWLYPYHAELEKSHLKVNVPELVLATEGFFARRYYHVPEKNFSTYESIKK